MHVSTTNCLAPAAVQKAVDLPGGVGVAACVLGKPGHRPHFAYAKAHVGSAVPGGRVGHEMAA